MDSVAVGSRNPNGEMDRLPFNMKRSNHGGE